MSNNDPYPVPSSETDRQVQAFLIALAKQWRKVVSCIVGEGLFALFLGVSGVTVAPLVYGMAAVIAITFGAFFAWRDQLRATEGAKEEIRQLKAKWEATAIPRMEIEFPLLRLEETYHPEPNLEAKVKNVSNSSIDGLGMIIERILPAPTKGFLKRNTDATFPWPLKSSEKVHRLNPDETFSIPIGAASFSAPSYAPNGEKYGVLRMANLDGSLSHSYVSFQCGKEYTMEVKATAHDYRGPLMQFTVRVERHSREESEWHVLRITKP
jgi:hypothetical protein